IQKYQVKLTYYINILEQKFKEQQDLICDVEHIELDRSITDVYKCVCLGIEETLVYIEECYGQYMDKKCTLSYLKRKKFIETHFEKSKHLIELFKAQKLPKRIEKEVCKPLRAILEDTLDSMNHMRRAYYRRYIDLFTRLLSSVNFQDKSEAHDQIYKLLIALNYNTHGVYKAMEEEALSRLDQLDTSISKQVFSFQQLNRIQSIAVTSDKYNSDFPGLKEYLITFIRKQIDLFEKQTELQQSDVDKTTEATIGIVDIAETKIVKRKINLTVSELALFSRLFAELEIISIKDNKHQYFKFLSQIYTSKDHPEISANSIKNGFYSSSEDTYASTERILIRMLHTLQKLRTSKAS
ncbi:hypothetical protein, partial [Aquimarina longa]|uniref:hypothetical protein n=1 Tax=Aquimarina longa TaxID=1080221 RepID=UPI000AE63320